MSACRSNGVERVVQHDAENQVGKKDRCRIEPPDQEEFSAGSPDQPEGGDEEDHSHKGTGVDAVGKPGAQDGKPCQLRDEGNLQWFRGME